MPYYLAGHAKTTLLLSTVKPFDSCTSRPDVCQCLVVHTPMHNMSNEKPSISMTHVACKSKFSSVVRPYMHPCPGNWVAIGRAVVYYYWAAHTLSAGIKCPHCTVAGRRPVNWHRNEISELYLYHNISLIFLFPL